MYDEAYIKENYKPIDEQRFPQIKKVLRDPKNFLWGGQFVKPSMFGLDMRDNTFRATVLVKTMDDVEYEAHGDGRNKVSTIGDCRDSSDLE